MSIFIRALVLSAATSLVACGGGGGKSDPKPSSVASSAGLSSSIASSTVSSFGTTSAASSNLPPSSAAQSSLMPASSASSQSSSLVPVSMKINGTINAFDVDGNTVALDEELVAIEVHSLDENDEPLQNVEPSAVGYGSDDSLRFNADLTGSTSGTVAITVSYPGYTSYSQKLGADTSIELDAKLQAVQIKTVEPGLSDSISGVTVDGFNINVSADDGSQQSDSMQIQIPGSLLPEGTESLDVAVRTFDPNDPEDKEFFPGAYADSNGNKLASVAFNFAEINTDAGEPLFKAMRKARQAKIAKAGGAHKAADDEPVIINRQIPPASCRLLESLGDSDPTTSGFQVPVYTYNPNSGLWDLLGHGTIYNAAREIVSENQTVFDCDNTNFYLEILVTNEIFLSNWWNLDYPITFTQPTNYCARIQVKNNDGETLSGITGYVWDENGDYDFPPFNFKTDSQGMAHIQVQQSAAETQASIYFFDINKYGYVKRTITLSTNCATPEVQVIELIRPSKCSVSGNISFKDGKPVERELIYAFSTADVSEPDFDIVNSDKDGNYRLSLYCNGGYGMAPLSSLLANMGSIDSWLHTITDGVVQTAEQSDDGKAVVMNPIQLEYSQPYVDVYYSYETDQAEVNFFGNYAAFPMEYSATIYSADRQTSYGTYTGTVELSGVGGDIDEFVTANMGKVTLNVVLPDQPDDYEYQVELNITDALNNVWTNVPTFIDTDRLPNDDDDEPNP